MNQPIRRDDSLLEEVLDASGADLACSFRVVRTSVGRAAVSVSMLGAESRLQDATCFDGVPDLSRPSMRGRRGFFEDASRERTGFLLLGRSYETERRHLLFQDRRLVGCVAVFHFGRPSPRSRRQSSGQLESKIDARLSRMEAVDRAYESLRGHLVLSRGGEVELCTPTLEGRIAPEELQRVIEAWQRDGFDRPSILRGCELKISRLFGPGRDALLVEVGPAPPIELAADAKLTPMQREVAAQAAAGATVPEIASSLSCAVETVRTHLREIYQRLGVANRIELAQVLEGSRSFD